MLVVHHPTDSENTFASIGFPGFVGAVTGFSEKVSQSEKSGKPIHPHGTYIGQGDAFFIRDVLQFANSAQEAVDMAKENDRTWAVWLGIGDENNNFIPMLYGHDEVKALDDKTLPNLTSQKQFDDLAYIDKHAQPSSHPDAP